MILEILIISIVEKKTLISKDMTKLILIMVNSSTLNIAENIIIILIEQNRKDKNCYIMIRYR